MLFRSLFAGLCWLLPFVVAAQCGLTVDAGPDRFYCPGGSLVQLAADISGPNVTGFTWSPTTGLDDPSSLTPRATITAPITYTLTAEVFDPSLNLIVNGDFEAGDTGFSTDYDLGTGGAFGLLSAARQYVISTNTSLTHINFANCPDHTGGGQMMVVNGSDTPNDAVWCQTIATDPNTTYRFSAWLMTVVADPNVADLQFTVNGSLLGSSFRASNTVCAWNEFSETWESGATTSAEICITNQNTASGGNDFAIDDLFFGPICSQSDEVIIDEVEIIAEAISPVTLYCDGFTFLDGFGSSFGPAYTYLWETTNGNIVSGATTLFPEVDAPGVYVLNVFYDDGQVACPGPAQTFVVVSPNNNRPTAVATQQTFIDCTNATATLSAAGSSTGGNIRYQWSTADGNIVGGENSAEAEVNQPGVYLLTVTDLVEDCSETAEVEVFVDLLAPEPVIDLPPALTCERTSLRLNATATVPRTEITIEWSTTDGNIIEWGPNQLEPLIDTAGTYTLRVVDDVNGCEAETSVTVTDGRVDLSGLTVAPPPAIDCRSTELRLMASEPTPGLVYEWSTTEGSIVADADRPTPLVNGAGRYFLRVSDPASGCSRQDSVDVINTAVLPRIALLSPPLFTCARAQMTLDASGTSSGNGISYSWSATAGGSIVADTNSLQPLVSGAGSYTLSVSNDLNGCTRDTTFSIGADLAAPVAEAGPGFELSCGTASAELDGSASSQGNRFNYQWTTTNGSLSGPTDTLRPTIIAAGTYQLAVTDLRNGCSTTDTVVVGRDDSAPDIFIASPDTLTCAVSVITLNADGSANDPGLDRQWTTADGNIRAGAESLQPQVDAVGTYTLTISDPANGCPAVRSVTVVNDLAAPPANAGAPVTLTCATPAARLGAIGLDPAWQPSWRTVDGELLADEATPTPLVGSPGRYYLRVENPRNGCSAVDSVDVAVSDEVPEVDLGPPLRQLTCRDQQLELAPAGTADHLIFAWSATNGGLLTDTASASVTVASPGTYQLMVTDTLNGCTATDLVNVELNQTPPPVSITPPDRLTCTADAVTIDGVVSAGPGLSLRWQTTDGQLVGPTNAGAATATAPGTYELLVINSATGCRDSARVTVAIDTVAPRARIAPPPPLSCNNDTLRLDGSASDGAAGFSWTWGTDDGNLSGDVTGLTPAVNVAGTYFITVRNQRNGCTTSDTVTVTSDERIPPLLLGDFIPPLNCFRGQVQLGEVAGAGDDLAHSWRRGPGVGIEVSDTPTAIVSAPGTYRLTVRDTITGCEATDSVTVLEDRVVPDVILPAVDDFNCFVTERELSTAPPPPGRNHRYGWSTTDGNLAGPVNEINARATAPGTYQLIISDPVNGCRDTNTLTVGIDTLMPQARIEPTNELTCDVESVALNGSASSVGPDLVYRWSTAEGQFGGATDGPLAAATAPGTYRLLIINQANNCVDSANVTVTRDATVPELSAAPATELTCRILTTQLSATATAAGFNPTINWATTDGNIVSGANDLMPTIDQPGVYRLTVVNPTNDCRSTIDVTVTQNIAEPAINLAPTVDLGCEDAPFDLTSTATGSGTLIYRWTTTNGMIESGAETNQPVIRGQGTYQLVVTDEANGCTSEASLLAEQNLLEGFDFTQTLPDCQTPFGSVAFGEVNGGTSPFLYSINGGETFSTATAIDSLRPARYELIVQDAAGCEFSRTLEVPAAPKLEISLEDRTVLGLGDNYRLNLISNFADSALTTVTWSPALELDCTDCLRPVATPTASRVYRVEVASVDGCTARDSLLIILDNLEEVYFPTAFSPDGDGVNDLFQPLGRADVIRAITDFTIFDRWGGTVFRGQDLAPNDPNGGWDGSVGGQPLNPAVFIYSATVEFMDGRVRVFKGDVMLVR